MMITDNLFLKGVELNFNVSSELLHKIYKYRDSLYYLSYKSLVNLDELRENLLSGILEGENKEITLRYKYNKIKTVKLLSWNIHFNMLTYYDPLGAFTLQFTRAGARIYPNSDNYNLNLNKAIDFILTLERANFLEVCK